MTNQGAAIDRELEQAREASQRLEHALGQIIVGQREVIQQTLWCLLAGGHVLLEGAPGLGKTLLVRTLSECLRLSFSRIQFTPDLMPSDITGTNVLVLDGRSSERFELQRGPIFGQLVLADEINRATPKTQSALLEAMQEHAVTIAGTRHALPAPFMVLATQNPIEMEGTYALPEAQLDRFLLKVLVPAPSAEQLTDILALTTGQTQRSSEPVLDDGEVERLQRVCREIVIARPLLDYVARLVSASDPENADAPPLVKQALRYGASVRAGQSLVLAAKARALLAGRPNVAFDDIRAVAQPSLRHRLLLSFAGEAEGKRTDDIVLALLEHVPERPKAVQQAIA
jgi:MoxR-like ATPase